MTMEQFRSTDHNRLIALGLIALGAFLFFGIGNLIVPILITIFITAPGLAFMAVYHTGRDSTAPFAIPGALITGTGLLLTFQSLTGYFESWAYAWTLYGVFLGYGLRLMGTRLSDDTLVTVGRVFMIVGGLAFAVFGGLFILLTNNPIRIILAIVLVLGGVYMLVKGQRNTAIMPKPKRSAETVEDNIQQIKVDITDNQDIA